MANIKQRAIAAVLAASMLLPYSLGYSSELLESKALQGNGTGASWGYSSGSGSYDGISDLGLRVYVYNSATKQIVTNSSGKQLIKDICHDKMITKVNNYKATKLTSTRLGAVSGSIDWVYGGEYNDVVWEMAYQGTCAATCKPATAAPGYAFISINVTGSRFYDWMMDSTGAIDNWKESVYGKLGGEYKYNGTRLLKDLFGNAGIQAMNPSTDYLIVEPLVLMDNIRVDSWGGWVSGSCGGNLGYCWKDSANGAVIGNGFRLNTKEEKLNLDYVDATLTSGTSGLTAEYLTGTPATDAKTAVPGKGWGIQAYSLTGLPIPGGGDPINSYDIHNNPTEPDKPETPGDSNQNPAYPDDSSKTLNNKGDVDIVKVYAKAYKDVNGGYTHVDPVGVYRETEASNHVIITDESKKNGGYKVVDWDTSTVKRFRPLIFLR